jgi:hypothetical protein
MMKNATDRSHAVRRTTSRSQFPRPSFEHFSSVSALNPEPGKEDGFRAEGRAAEFLKTAISTQHRRRRDLYVHTRLGGE